MKGRLADERRLGRLERQYGLMRWLAVIEPKRRRYWEAAERRILREMEPLYWEVMPDLEKVERVTQFEMDDYRHKRMDWLRDGGSK